MELDIPAKSVDEVGSGFQLIGIGIERNPLSLGCNHLRLKVATVSLDGVIADLGLRPSVLKIDVEGAELEVLRGAAHLLRSCRPEASVGFHPFAFGQPASAQAEIISMLEEAGLTFGPLGQSKWILGEYMATRREPRDNP